MVICWWYGLKKEEMIKFRFVIIFGFPLLGWFS